MEIVLLAGLWLRRSVWTEVCANLAELGHRPIPVELPGVDDASPTATLDDQLKAVLVAIDSCPAPVAVVGHSAACRLCWYAPNSALSSQGMDRGGRRAELVGATNVTFADIDSGHWPMVTQAARLAEIIDDIARPD